MPEVPKINSLAEFEEAIKDPKLVVIDFYADWCGPCKMIAPQIQKLHEDAAYADVKFYKVNVDDADEVSEHCKITAMPTFLFFKDGKKIEDELKGASKDKLIEKIEQHR